MKRLQPSFIRPAGGAEAPPAVLLTSVLRLFVFQLHEVYSRLCAQRQVSAVGQGECLSLCSLLESRGIIALKKAKEARLTKVRTSHLSPAAHRDITASLSGAPRVFVLSDCLFKV